MVANLNSFIGSGLTPVKPITNKDKPSARRNYNTSAYGYYSPTTINNINKANILDYMRNSTRNMNSQILPIPEVVYNPLGSVISTVENISGTTNPLLKVDNILTSIQDKKFWYTIIAIIIGAILIIISVQGFIYSEGIGNVTQKFK